MSQSLMLQAAPRAEFGKERMKKMRRAGQIPGVIYGAGAVAEHITVPSHEFDVLYKRIHGQTVILDVELTDANGGKKTEQVFVRDIQRDPVTDIAIHVDFLRVDANAPIIVEVPVIPTGIPEGVKLGGVLEVMQRAIRVRCLPAQVPPYITVDISSIMIGSSLHAEKVPWPKDIEILSAPETVLFIVVGKKEEEEVAAVAAVPGAEAGAAEPEVIGKKKKEEEGAEEGKEKKPEAKK